MQGEFYSALGVVWVFGVAAVVIITWNLRNKRRLEKLQLIHQERMKAMEKGIPLPEFPEMDEVTGAKLLRQWNPRWPLGIGVLLIMAGIGTIVAMLASPEFDDVWSFGFIGIFVGIGFFLHYYLTRTPQS